MAPTEVTEDYYAVLEVGQHASLEMITRSYKRLALKRHPDRNPETNAKEQFQLLGQAYETLRDAGSRRIYDLKYPALRKTSQAPPNAETSSSSPFGTAQSPLDVYEAQQLAKLKRGKEERAARWRLEKISLESSIFEQQRAIRQLKAQIRPMDETLTALAAAEAAKNSWSTWLWSPLYKKREETEQQKARRERIQQEHRIAKDIKERRLSSAETQLAALESQLHAEQKRVEGADAADDDKSCDLLKRMQARLKLAREAKEREDARRQAEVQRRQEELRREEQSRQADLRKREAERRAAQARKEADDMLARLHAERAEQGRAEERRRAREAPRQRACTHAGWWPKEIGRMPCSRCYDVWTYLLVCPGCSLKACPKCQAEIRPARTGRAPPRRSAVPAVDSFTYAWD